MLEESCSVIFDFPPSGVTWFCDVARFLGVKLCRGGMNASRTELEIPSV